MLGDRETFAEHLNVSRETLEKLDRFVELLGKWTVSINLIARKARDDVWIRHILDSAQLDRFIPDNAMKIVDIGSGGGLPALVLAILSTEKATHRHFTLIESDLRKCAFLSLVIRELGLSAEVLAQRSEVVTPQQADVITSRAFAPLDRMMPELERHLSEAGCALLLKGRGASDEIKQARQNWNFTVELNPSITEPSASIIRLDQISRV